MMMMPDAANMPPAPWQTEIRGIGGHNQLPKLIQGVKFADGIEIVGNTAVSIGQAAA
jgi:hypothetical protein